MYKTIDELSRGKVFWSTVVNAWSFPYSLNKVKEVVLSSAGEHDVQDDQRHALVVVQSERVDGADCLYVRIRRISEAEPCLSVIMTRGGEYISGVHNGAPIDETGAVEALSLYRAKIRGVWGSTAI